MLTKQEREEIAQRAKESIDSINVWDPYYILTGNHIPKDTSIRGDRKKMASIILDLCDTSNMVELPRDKDGVPIHIGDTVWYDGEVYQVASIKYDDTGLFDEEIYIRRNTEKFRAFWRELSGVTHTEPISDHESIARAIEDVIYHLDDAAASLKLQDIAMALRELGDDNE